MSEKTARRKRRRAEIVADLQEQLQAHGYQYVGSDLDELREIVPRVESLRAEKPPCWGRSFDPKEELCLRCELIRECGELCVQPQFDLSEPVEPVECSECDGDLIIELFNSDGKVNDHGCSTPGCSQTLTKQRGGT